MADIPKAPLEGSSSESIYNMPLLTMTEDDGASDLQATLLRAIHTSTVNSQRLGSVRIARRDVRDGSVFPSLARTATVTQDAATNKGRIGIFITVDVTVYSAGSLLLSLLTSDDEALWEAAAAISATGTFTYVICPYAVAAEDVVEVAKMALPHTWKVKITHSTSDSITYSVGVSYII